MIKIDPSEFTFTFSKSSGSGGQNVNKLNTQATLTWDMKNSGAVSELVKERFCKLYKRFVSTEGQVVIQSQRHRSQKRNKDDCVEKLRSMINAASKPPKKRRPTKPTRAAVKKRLESKKKRSEKKKLRKVDF